MKKVILNSLSTIVNGTQVDNKVPYHQIHYRSDQAVYSGVDKDGNKKVLFLHGTIDIKEESEVVQVLVATLVGPKELIQMDIISKEEAVDLVVDLDGPQAIVDFFVAVGAIGGKSSDKIRENFQEAKQMSEIPEELAGSLDSVMYGMIQAGEEAREQLEQTYTQEELDNFAEVDEYLNKARVTVANKAMSRQMSGCSKEEAMVELDKVRKTKEAGAGAALGAGTLNGGSVKEALEGVINELLQKAGSDDPKIEPDSTWEKMRKIQEETFNPKYIADLSNVDPSELVDTSKALENRVEEITNQPVISVIVYLPMSKQLEFSVLTRNVVGVPAVMVRSTCAPSAIITALKAATRNVEEGSFQKKINEDGTTSDLDQNETGLSI